MTDEIKKVKCFRGARYSVVTKLINKLEFLPSTATSATVKHKHKRLDTDLKTMTGFGDRLFKLITDNDEYE